MNLKKTFIQIPQTIVFKIRNIGKFKYQVLIFGVFGSVLTSITVAFAEVVTKNLLCMFGGKMLGHINAEAYSESIKLHRLFFSLHTSYWTTLRIIGLGYKVLKKASDSTIIILHVGFSHVIVCKVPTGVMAFARKRVVKLWSHSYDLLKSFSYKLMLIKHQKDSFRATGLVPANAHIRLKIGKVSRV